MSISIALNFVCVNYFHVRGQNILYSACYFLAGGVIYLYRNKIEKFSKWIVLAIVMISTVFYYIWNSGPMACLLISSALLSYAIISERGILENRVTKFISSISMEVYLSHMAIFRVIEKMKWNTVLGNGWIQYFFTVCLVLGGTIVFSVAVQFAIKTIERQVETRYIPKEQ